MPELPEVESTLNGIKPFLLKKTVKNVVIRSPKLRWPIPKQLPKILSGKKIIGMERRGKYILFRFTSGTMLMHLGMSGHTRIYEGKAPEYKKHDHFELIVNGGCILRFNDARRFGSILWTDEPVEQHKLICKIGPEPLEKDFNAKYLYEKCQSSKRPIKNVIMDSHVVPGVGNIYANESLFMAQISPMTQACDLSIEQCKKLCSKVKSILKKAIKKGGTTLKDFSSSDGKPGYFAQELLVYGREGESCYSCNQHLESIRMSGRQTVFCPNCQGI